MLKSLKARIKTTPWSVLTIMVALSILSGGMTGYGIFGVIEVQFPAEQKLYVALSTAFAMLIVQGAIILGGHYTLEQIGISGRTIALVILLSFVSISVIFASGSWYLVTDQKGVQRKHNMDQFKPIMLSLRNIQSNARGVSAKMQQVSRLASDKARYEKRTGKSCVGQKTDTTCGPRCRLRLRHADKAKKLGREAQAITIRVTEIVTDLAKSGYKKEAIYDAFAQASALINSESQTGAANWLRSEAANFNSQFTDPDTGEVFQCRDPSFVNELRTALALIERGVELPTSPPPVGPVDLTHSIKRIILEVWASLSARLEGNPRGVYPEIPSAFKIALANDVATILLLLLNHFIKATTGGVKSRHDRFAERAKPPSREQRLGLQMEYALLTGLSLEQNDAVYFARPINSSQAEINEVCARLARTREFAVRSDLKVGVPLAHPIMFPNWVRDREHIHKGATEFILHPLRPEDIEYIRRIGRDLAA